MRGFFVSTDKLSLRAKFQKNNTESRFSIVVPASVTKSKPTKNRLRRQGYTIIRKLLKNLDSGYTAIVFLKKESKNLTYPGLEKEIVKVFKKAKIFKQS